MSKSIKDIREEIYNFPKNHEFFKNKSFIQCCFSLTCAHENMFLNLTNPYNNFDDLYLSVEHDKLRADYREALKDAYRFCDKNNSLNTVISLRDLELASDEINRCGEFNPIRNLFEQYDLGKYNIKINDDFSFEFLHNNPKREQTAILYAKWIDNEKPERKESEYSKNNLDLYKYMMDYRFLDGWTPNNRKTNSSNFIKIYNSALEKIVNDFEEYSYEFNGFNSNDFLEIYAVIMTIGILDYNYHFYCRLFNKVEINNNTPIVIIKEEELYKIINKTTNIEKSVIDNVFKYLVYDPDFHKDKVSILQPLFKSNNIFFYSAMQVFFSIAHDKFLYQIKESKNYEKVISQIAHDREEIMTIDILDFLNNNSNLYYCPNLKIIDNNKTLAEFDIVIYDEEHHKILLTELKWFFMGDGKKDHYWIDEKIRSAIKSRLEKESIAKKYINQIKKELEIDNNEELEIMSCIVSKNYSGSDFIQDDLAIFDEFLFKALLNHCNFNLDEFFIRLKTHNYIPDMNTLGFKFYKKDINYAGYRVGIESIAYKY